MKKYYGLVIVLLLLHVCGTAQVDQFQEIYKNFGKRGVANVETASKMVHTQDGGYAIAGTWEDSAYVVKLDACGATLWSKTYSYGSASLLNGVCELPNGNLAAAGNCDHCVIGDSLPKGLVLLLDPVGNVLKDTTLGNLNLGTTCNDIITTLDGGIAVTGYAVMASFFGPTDALLAKFDANLNLLHYRTVETKFYESGNSITNVPDSGLAVAGYTSDYLFEPASAVVYRFDQNCDTVWTQENAIQSTNLFGIVADASGKLVASGWQDVDSIQNLDVFVWAIDATTGNHISDQTYGGYNNDLSQDLIAIEGGYLIVANNGDSSGWGIGIRDWLLYLDANLAPVDSVFYGRFLQHREPFSLVPLSPDGQEFAYVTKEYSFGEVDFQWVKRHRNAGKRMNFTVMPLDYQLYPRDSVGFGHVNIEGDAIAGSGQYNTALLEIYRDNVLNTIQVQALAYSSGLAHFNFTYDLPAELHNYYFLVKGFDGSSYHYEADGCDVVAGDALIITGQSNAHAGSPGSPYDSIYDAWDFHANAFVRNFGLKYGNDSVLVWHKEDEDDNPFYGNYSGNWGLVMADNIVRDHNIPVAIINGGIGGIPIDYMLANPSDHRDTSTTYGKFLRRVERAGLQDDIRSILFFQGETNGNLAFLDSVPSYLAKFNNLYSAWATDFPGRQYDFLFQIRHSNNFGVVELHSLMIAEAQREIADIYTNMSIMSSTGMNHDGVHYFYANGYERAGEDMYRLLNRDLYHAPSVLNTDPPSIDFVRFANAAHTELDVVLRNAGDALTWYPGFEFDFILEGVSDSVISGSVSGNVVHLQLSAAPSTAFRGLSYRSHAIGDQCPVKNANGIGMLVFYKQPVLPFVGVDAAMTEQLQVWPNPISDTQIQIGITSNETGRLQLQWIAANGQVVGMETVEFASGNTLQSLVTPSTKGLYLLKASNSEGQAQIFRIVRL